MGACAGIHTGAIDECDSPPPIKEKPRHSYASNTDTNWFDPQFHDKNQSRIKKPDELERILIYPPEPIDKDLLDRVLGSLIGLALGDALGAHVEFRPRQYLVDKPVEDLQPGGTWGLNKGQFTDDTSMALCLAISLIACRGFSPYDQLVRYKWWYRNGYMSSTGECFDIGAATSESLREFEQRQKKFAKDYQINANGMDFLSEKNLLKEFDPFCSNARAAGNGGLMRLSPVPLFFQKFPREAVEYSGISAKITHGDRRVYDACRFYGALIVAAIKGETKEQMLSKHFYQDHEGWFNHTPLDPEIQEIVEGSYKKKKNGYDDGIRGKGFVVFSLEAALWAFYCDENSFEKGALLAVNLGDDADTTAAIYGQLAGTYYGYGKLPKKWVKEVYAQKFITCLSKWIVYEGQMWAEKYQSTTTSTSQPASKHHSDTSTAAKSSKKRVEDEHFRGEEKPKKPRK